jgi:hypothetical protein
MLDTMNCKFIVITVCLLYEFRHLNRRSFDEKINTYNKVWFLYLILGILNVLSLISCYVKYVQVWLELF